jgi:hypothetical protein
MAGLFCCWVNSNYYGGLILWVPPAPPINYRMAIPTGGPTLTLEYPIIFLHGLIFPNERRASCTRHHALNLFHLLAADRISPVPQAVDLTDVILFVLS